jgi:alpha-beta hydrolase superfamily lysophospholipase
LPYTVKTHEASDGYPMQYRHYAPAGQGNGRPASPRARVVCVHGIQSHSGWYETSCVHLARASFDVYFLDRRGCGMNQQDRGDAPSYRRLLDDLAEFAAAVRGAGAVPLFLLGISWGGKPATALLRWRPGLADGLVLISPGFFPRMDWKMKLRSGMLSLVAQALPRKRLRIPVSWPELFTATPRWQEYIRNDPLLLGHGTLRLLTASIKLDYYLRQMPPHVRVPVLLMLGDADRILEIDRTRRFVEKFASPDKEIIVYPGAHHTLEFEAEPEPFLGDLQHWLEKHSPAPPRHPGEPPLEGR